MVNTVRVITIVMLAVVFLQACTTDSPEKKENNVRIDSLQQVIKRLQTTSDSLRFALDHVDTSGYDWFHPDYEGRMMKQRGIEQPEQFIEQALQKRPELIPLDPVLGGTMRYSHIEVLSKKWVIAAYEDGHIMGKSIYQYHIQPDTTIEFQILDSIRP